jgi:undecaprenyl-diphosphatase
MEKGHRLKKILAYSRLFGIEEVWILLTLAILGGGIWAFAEIADEVLEGSARSIDEILLLALRNPDNIQDPLGPLWLERAMGELTMLGGITFLTLLSMIVLGFLLLEKKKNIALLVFCSIFGGFILNQSMKFAFSLPRPDLVPHGVKVLTSSFPSGHSMLSAITYLTLGGLLARVNRKRHVKIYILAVAVLLTLTVGFSRIYLGVHWPSDVLAGWTAGATWALFCWFIAFLLQRRGAMDSSIE